MAGQWRECWGNIGDDGCRRVMVRKQINESTCRGVALQISGALFCES